jgi:hypothetical protein
LTRYVRPLVEEVQLPAFEQGNLKPGRYLEKIDPAVFAPMPHNRVPLPRCRELFPARKRILDKVCVVVTGIASDFIA